MKAKKALALILVIVMAISLLAACGEKDKTGGEAKTDPDKSGTAASGESIGEEIKVDQGTVDAITSNTVEVLNVAIPQDIGTFNPWKWKGQGANQALHGIYQPLLHLVDGVYYPAIMKSDFTFSDDGLSMYCEIFDNVYDSAGNHLTVDDVIFSMNQSIAVWPELSDIIKDIVKTGDYTFTFEFQRKLYVAELDSITRTFMVTEKAFKDSPDEMATTPVGTGQYVLDSYTSGYSATYTKRDGFWQTDATQICARDMANVEKLNYYVISESAQRTIALEDGTIDICMSVSAEDRPNFDGKNGFKLVNVASKQSLCAFYNVSDNSPCSDVNLRLAISYAISGDAVLQSVYNGTGNTVHEMSPSSAAGYDPAWDEEDNYFNYDVAAAKEYLAKSGYNGEELIIMCEPDATTSETAQLIQNFLTQINVKSKVETYETSVFSEYSTNSNAWDIMIDHNTTNVYWVQALYSNFSQTRYATGTGVNFVKDDELQRLLELCMNEDTHTNENLNTLHDYMIENCFAKALVNEVNVFVVPEEVQDVVLSYRGFIMSNACIF